MKTKQIIAAVALTLMGSSSFAMEHDTKAEEKKGAIAGMVIGASIAGPIGAGLGGIVGGAIFGKMFGTLRVVEDLETQLAHQVSLNARKVELEQALAKLNIELDEMIEVRTANLNRQDSPIQFRTNSSDIEDHYQSQLNEMANTLISNKSTKVTLSGFADRRGSEIFNQQLSENRVKQVRTYLIDQGVDANQIVAIGFGESQPLIQQENSENNFFDRRVQMQISQDIDIATR